jgi:glycosyltransferase involved in cell wall biosynthesis
VTNQNNSDSSEAAQRSPALPSSFDVGTDPQLIEVPIAANIEHVIEGAVYGTRPTSETVTVLLKYFRRAEQGPVEVPSLMAQSELYPDYDVFEIEPASHKTDAKIGARTLFQLKVLPAPGADLIQIALVCRKTGDRPTHLCLNGILPVSTSPLSGSGVWAKHILGTEDLKDQFVSVIIPVYNQSRSLRKCLVALRAQEEYSGGHEIIVVDNASTDDIRSVTDDFPDVTYLLHTEVGSYAARNAGAAIAKGSVLAFTDADCVPHPDWLRRGVNSLLSADTPRIVVGRIVMSWRNGKGPNTIAGWWERCFGFSYQRRGLLGATFLRHGVTATMFILRDTHERMNGFEEAYYSGGDTDFSNRCNASGIRVRYDKTVVVSHPAREDVRSVLEKRLRIYSNQYCRERHMAQGSVFRFFFQQLIDTCRLRRIQVEEFGREMPELPVFRLKAFVVFEFFMYALELTRITLRSGNGARRR